MLASVIALMPLALVLMPTGMPTSCVTHATSARLAIAMEASAGDSEDVLKEEIATLQATIQSSYEKMFAVKAGPSADTEKKALREEIDALEADVAAKEAALRSLSGKALRYSAVGRMRQKAAAASDQMSEAADGGGGGDFTQTLNKLFEQWLSGK